jgi:hypothetical protein
MPQWNKLKFSACILWDFVYIIDFSVRLLKFRTSYKEADSTTNYTDPTQFSVLLDLTRRDFSVKSRSMNINPLLRHVAAFESPYKIWEPEKKNRLSWKRVGPREKNQCLEDAGFQRIWFWRHVEKRRLVQGQVVKQKQTISLFSVVGSLGA